MRRRVRRLLVVAGLLVLGVLATLQAFDRYVLVDGHRLYLLGDDAMISMRYAYNLAHGRGFVWNPGEYVQGYTNLGWTLVMAAIHWLGVPLQLAPLAVLLVNAVVYIGLLVLLLLRLPPLAGTVAALLVALDGSLIVWTLNGFEVTLQATLIALTVLPFLGFGSTRWAPIWAAMAVVVRPDAGLVLVWVALLLIWRRELRWPLGAALALVLAVFVFQRAYYGDWLPNTFHLKVPAGLELWGRGLEYVARFAFGEFFSLPLLLAPLALAFIRPGLAGVCALPLAWVLYVVSVGGDAFEHGRFIAPMVPIMAACAGLVLEGLWRDRERPVVRVVILAAVAALGLHVARAAPLLLVRPTVHDASGMAAAIRVIPSSALVGVFAAGTVPYYLPEHRFHDMLGKVDRWIARGPARNGPPGHNKWDYRHSLEGIRPTFIISLGPSGMDARDLWFLPDLGRDATFRREYRVVAVSPDGNVWVSARREKDD